MSNVQESGSTDAFVREIYRVINYFADEFDISYVETIGALEIIKADLLDNMAFVAHKMQQEQEGESGEGWQDV